VAVEKKDWWDKADIIFKVAVVPVVLAALGIFANHWLEKRQEIEARTRLYAELMSRREDADTSLRKEMFKYIIETFLTPKSAGSEQKVLALELLAYNFHEALDLSPLFKHVRLNIPDKPANKEYIDRLEKSAKDVAGKQVVVLEEAGGKLDGQVDFEELAKTPQGLTVIEDTLELRSAGLYGSKGPSRKRHFKVQVLAHDMRRKELRVKLEVTTPRETEEGVDSLYSLFWLGFFDFPMIDNTRLSNGDRCAIVLRRFESSSADLTLVYFPATRASLKDKPYYDEVLGTLLQDSGQQYKSKGNAK
jgi:hypothetical protein